MFKFATENSVTNGMDPNVLRTYTEMLGNLNRRQKYNVYYKLIPTKS